MEIVLAFLAFVVLSMVGVFIVARDIPIVNGKREGPGMDLIIFNTTWAPWVGIFAGIAYGWVNRHSATEVGALLAQSMPVVALVGLLAWVVRFCLFFQAGNQLKSSLLASHILIALGYWALCFGFIRAYNA